MKLCKLKLKNLNSFRKNIEIDFEDSPLGDASLVAITGPTGAGKTTLLDAICVALYGKTPRLSGNQNQHPRHLISHGKMEGFAEVHFEANGARYHATWSIKRKGSPKAQLFDDSGELITTKVAQEVGSILGFDFDTFKRSIMLAQGEFAAFLRADLKDRREILEKTAGIGIYNKLNDKLNEKENEVRKTYEHLNLKLDVMPAVSRNGITLLEKELDKLNESAKEFDGRNRKIQKEIESEKKRKEDYEKLQSSKKRQEELSNQQPDINALQAEVENAQCAERLRPEKQAFDTTKSELEKVVEALVVAATEKTDVEDQVKTDQTDFDEKETAYQDASDDHNRKKPIYTNAKVDVGRAVDQIAEASKRTPDLADLESNIVALDGQLAGKQSHQAQLQGQITNAKNFLDKNPLPSDRQHRLNRATGLLAELDAQQKQLETESQSKTEHDQKVSSLKLEIGRLSKDSQKRLSKKTGAETALKTATDELNVLLASGIREEWDVRKQQAIQVQPIAQRYEIVEADLVDSEDDLRKLNETKADLNAELEQIEDELGTQAEVCQRAAEAVQDCEAARESTLLADSVNHFRQRLQPGEPCEVCGATEHPRADVVEPDSEDLLQAAENALDNAKSEARSAELHRQHLNTRQVQIEQNKRNTTEQIDEGTDEIEKLQDERGQLLVQWKVLYPGTDISSDWIADQITEMDTAIAAIGTAEKTRTNASHSYQTATQQFENCEKDLKRERKFLTDSEKQLQNVIDAVEDLKEDIASTENSFWDLLPESFHGVTPKEAKDQFDSKIKAVEAREEERRKVETQLQLLETNIKTDQRDLEHLKVRRIGLQDEINQYRDHGKAFLNAVREKTGGLETEYDIDDAINKLEAELQSKKAERDASEQRLQKSQNLLTGKAATHMVREKQQRDSSAKLKKNRQNYFDKLSEEGFDSLEAHDNAFRNDAQIQKLTDQIDAHEDEKRQLGLDITQLRPQFEMIPFDPEALEQIEIKAEEIDSHSAVLQRQIGEKEQEKRRLKDVLSDREALESEVRHAAKELERWENLKDLIGENKLFNFASTIILEQVNRLANGQLESLSSGRYQLKAEGVDDKLKLTIIDRWNANEERPVETLSGGESFLTSLALALALSDLSRGRAQLNSLFLDEGFGTLDTETLDIAITALEGLHMHGRSIFFISHVQELTRRLPIKINVRKHGDNSLDSLDSSYSSSIQIRD